MTEFTPEAEKVTFALLGLVEVLALLVVTANVLFPVPDAVDKFNHVASSITDQLVFETTLMFPVEPEVEAIDTLEGVADKEGQLFVVNRYLSESSLK